MRNSVSNFVDLLREVHLENCFNPYSSRCVIHDVDGAAEIRSKNLSSILSKMTKAPKIDIWIGRDLGHRGGRRTGIALTDEVNLETYANLLGIKSLSKCTRGAAVKEQTAANVFKVMKSVDVPVLTWNVFPLHPHYHQEPFTNRQHNKKEEDLGLQILENLISMFSVRKCVAIGNHASAAIRKFNLTSMNVRHPSYGGQAVFLSGMREIYGAPIVEERQGDLF